ncbi:MAG: PQQ-binding-like beta-propeller repeat protein [Pirellulaceae bacterium]
MKRSWLAAISAVCLATLVSTTVPLHAQEPAKTVPAQADPLDWTYWRGPEYNSISRETGLPDTIDPEGGEGSNLSWKRDDLGGRSTPIVMRGKLYMILRADPGTATEGERVVCIDAATGKDIWQSRHNISSSEVPDTRVGWSSVVGDPATGRVYALGSSGLFECFEGETGKIVWSLPLSEQLGVLSTYGGRTNFPVVVDELVILGAIVIGWGDMAMPAHRFLAFDKATGEIRWFVTTRLRPEDTTYSAPVLAVVNGQKLLIAGAGDGWLYALQPRTGKIVWEYELSRRGLNLSPTYADGVVYMGHEEENLVGTSRGALVAVKADGNGNVTQSGELWKYEGMMVGKSPLLKVGDRLYVNDSSKMYVLDAKTGEPIGRPTRMGTINYAAPLYADGKIYHVEQNARWYILTPDAENGLAKLQRGKSMGTFPNGENCLASPIVSHGRLYILTTGGLYCFEDKSQEHGVGERPALPQETPVSEDEKPAHVQVVPAELLLEPGDKQQLTVRLFNSRGQFLKESPATFTVSGSGAVGEGGEFTAPDDASHTAAIITAKVGDLTGLARIRIIPPLPWKFDFEGKTDAPVTWVGMRYRHVIRQMDGSTVLTKITTIPKGTKSRGSIGPSDLSDYTVQVDFKAAKSDNDKLSDVGVIAQGYTLEVSSANRWLKLLSWGSHDKRTFKEMDFDLEPDVWYTLKLRAANADGKANLQGKIWKRGEPEPEAWTIEMTDPMPNTHGAPGLAGNATNAELYLDNVLVTSNSAN